MTGDPQPATKGAPRSRRRVLAALAGIAVLGAGYGIATWRPAPQLITAACQGGTRMPGKVLFAYATRTGSTAEVADAIAKRLCAAGLSADVRPIDQVTDLAEYGAAVLGSAVRYAAWLPEMTDWVATQRTALSAMPTAFFTMHMLALGDDPAAVAEREKYTAKTREVVSPITEAFFAGKIDPARLSFLELLAVRLVKSPIGDKRDWSAIEGWADGLAPRLAEG